MIQSTKGFCTVVCVSVTRSVYDYVISLEQREDREREERRLLPFSHRLTLGHGLRIFTEGV